MSIDTKLAVLLGKQLFELGTVFTGEETARTMIVTADILAVVDPPTFADTLQGERLGEFRGWLDNFSLNGELTVALDPDNKPPETMLARVRPAEDDFWSIRVTAPEETA